MAPVLCPRKPALLSKARFQYTFVSNKTSPQDHTEGIAYCFKANVLSKTPLFLSFMEPSLPHSSVLLMHDVGRAQLPPAFCKRLVSRISTNQSIALICRCFLDSFGDLFFIPCGRDSVTGRKMTAFSQTL